MIDHDQSMRIHAIHRGHPRRLPAPRRRTDRLDAPQALRGTRPLRRRRTPAHPPVEALRGGGHSMSRLFAIENVVDSDDWYTPAWIFDGLGLTFDLDVAAPDGGPPNVPAQTFYTVADDGLLSPWFGTVWCNPPYSDPGAWCRKWADHEAGCILIRSDLSTSGPFVAWSAAHAAYVPPKRLQFTSGAGKATGAVNFSTVLLGRGEHVVEAMHRLAGLYGGATRTLVPA